MNERYYKSLMEVVFGEKKNPVVMFDKVAKTIEHVAYYIAEGGRIAVNHLPLSGYSISKYDPEEYDEKFVFLNCDVYPFWEVMFLDDAKHPVLNLETDEVKMAVVKVVPSGVGTCFCLQYDDVKEYRPRNEYEKKFVVLKE